MQDVDLKSDDISCLTFFQIVFGDTKGYVAIGYKPMGIDNFKETFFSYPQDVKSMVLYCNTMRASGDVYFCTQILNKKNRTKSDVEVCPNLWVDLDDCGPEHLEERDYPTVLLETSPSRYQGLWAMDPPVAPAIGEDLSKRLTYKYAEYGSDKNGWCLTKYLRVPGTYNYKRVNAGDVPAVRMVSVNNDKFTADNFTHLPAAKELINVAFPFPTGELETASDVLMRYRSRISPMAFVLYSDIPKKAWSGELWRLEKILAEDGLTKEEIFCIVREAKCNKYARDNRPEIELWREVCKCWSEKFKPIDETDPLESLEAVLVSKDLLTTDEKTWVQGTPTVVEDYIRWATSLSDAAWQYHEAGIFTILSGMLCGSITIPASSGTLFTNLWFMILANTTLTRKSTAMGIAMSVLDEIDPDILLATDGSPEGLLTALSTRSGQPSLFLRDEVSGLLESMKKEYMAGLAEALAKLYDGNRERRQLRKETIDIRNPRLILFTGGVKNRVFELLDHSHVLTGFLPRFIFVTAEPNMKNLRPMGPPTVETLGERLKLVNKLKEINDYYTTQTTPVIVNGTVVGQQKKIFEATLTTEAWSRVNKYSEQMVEEAYESSYRDVLVPTFDRLAKSGMKIAALLAACRNLSDSIVIEVEDVIRAFYYVEKWRLYALEVIENLGKSPFEKLLARAELLISREPGITKSKVMRACSLTSRTVDEVLNTLDQRSIIRIESKGQNGSYSRLFLNTNREGQ